MLWVPKRRLLRRNYLYPSDLTMTVSLRNFLINILSGSTLPALVFILHLLDIVTFATFKLFSCIFFVIFVIFPLIFKFSYRLQNSVVFLNFVHIPVNANYHNPEKYGLEGSRNFYLTTRDGITLGIWQILPEELAHHNETDDGYFETVLSNGRDVIIYNHGNAGSRLTGHRVELYKVLRRHFHVITFDYRSYGDSSNIPPSEDGAVSDCMHVYEWVANRTSGHLFVWGHSLGTSLAIHSASLLQMKGAKRATGIVLEAPFNNLKEEISEFPLARLFSGLPWFSYTVIQPMLENGFAFQTDQHICKVDAPILILHARDDHVVPFRLGMKLYMNALKCRSTHQGNVSFHDFDGKFKYDHKFIYRAPEIHDIISNFIQAAIKETKEKHLTVNKM